MRYDLRAVRTQLLLWFLAVLTAALALFGGVVYLGAVAAEAAEVEPQAEKDRELRGIRQVVMRSLFISTPVALLVAAAGAYLLGRRSLRVLGSVVHTANALSLEHLAQRIPNDPRAGSEIGDAVAALNAMLDRMERTANGLRRFTADAAHELRTPLAILASDIEVCLRRPRDPATLRETLESTLEGIGRLTRLVELLLTLARSDAGELPVARQTVDLDALLLQIADPYSAVAAEKELQLTIVPSGRTDSGDPLMLHTDPLLLGRAVANLLDNACKFTPPGGTITLYTTHTPDGVTIIITDDGHGLDHIERSRAFERFFRGAAHRGSTEGFGLGLSLTREFLTAIGGEVELRSRAGNGTGTQAVLRLPME